MKFNKNAHISKFL